MSSQPNFQRKRKNLRIEMLRSRRSESDPVPSPDYNMKSQHENLELQSMNNGRNVNNTKDDKNMNVPIINVPDLENLQLNDDNADLGPPSPGGRDAQNVNYRYNNHLVIPTTTAPASHSSPRVLQRSLSARVSKEYSLGSASPVVRKISRPPSLCVGPDFYADSISAINVPVETTTRRQTSEARALSILMSGIYAVFLLMLGCIVYINDQHRENQIYSQVFSSIISCIGILWLVIFHIDLCRYKVEVLKQLRERENAMQEASDRFSTATEFIINSGFTFSATEAVDGKESKPPPYRFLMGRHSGSFYLKIGLAGFCFGYLTYLGLQLGQHILNFYSEEVALHNCIKTPAVVLHVVTPIYAFYQLFITFKYSNIVINRHIVLARFGLMHLIATCMCNWFSTIVEEAVEDYTHKAGNLTDEPKSEFDIASFHIVVQRRENLTYPFPCSGDSGLSARSVQAIPYLYPFAIEYNLLLAGVWFVVWQNIGKEHMHSDPRHLRHTFSQDGIGSDEIAYQSNLVINADCHSANKGLFTGLFLLLTIIVTVIVFFVAMTTKGYESKAVAIHTVQEGALTLIGLIAVCVSFYQIRKLDLSEHPITFLDDVLLFVPLPFYFIHGIMSMMAEKSNKNWSRLALHILVTLQVVVQTPFIIDGLRRCSNSQSLRYRKPGREIITFLIILNLTLWIVNTFELKSVEHYHGQEEYFGDLVWMFIGHTTIPLMLFYRFHSSVCLADMWKSAYEKEAPQ